MTTTHAGTWDTAHRATVQRPEFWTAWGYRETGASLPTAEPLRVDGTQPQSVPRPAPREMRYVR